MKPMRESSPKICPVPLEQQPVNEYEALKSAWLYSWGQIDLLGYGKNLTRLALLISFIVSPIASASFSVEKQPIQCGFLIVLAICLLLSLFVLRLMLGWRYVGDRLEAETVTYEESGWYDGQVWRKPLEVQTRDQLILRYQVNPVLQRWQVTLKLLGVTMAIDLLLWAMFRLISA
ncbi:CGLD27 family protein [Synechocystis salina]|uniref:CGLD27 family protein n=1 Tax=Synechocystis salina LEGE 00031 TaxID=1828736 RepID=A0ABR9VPI9_9SYNC|nr:CGLD27 family protein [Synechocystis salina]MBE9241826.1 CGLD27 family protein [Synechocystis salina LEGE 00041]MBE9253254.1 CGLD27 family protein [Synechocystis salina LEGE 00031]